jgi:hypothetical protein
VPTRLFGGGLLISTKYSEKVTKVNKLHHGWVLICTNHEESLCFLKIAGLFILNLREEVAAGDGGWSN